MVANTRPPKVFISYAWEDDIKPWVRAFAKRLRKDGVETVLDQWETEYGDQLPEFMEKAVRASDFVILICTPKYKKKSDDREGGVGYEGHIITAEIFEKSNHRKFIPVLKKGIWALAAPSWAAGKLYIDLRANPYSEENYRDLLRTLHGKRPTAPPIGAPPNLPNEDDDNYRKPNLFTKFLFGLKESFSLFMGNLKLALPKTKPFFRIAGFTGVIIGLFWAGSWVMPKLYSLVPTARPAATVTLTPSLAPPTDMLSPAPAKTKAPTSTPIGGGQGQFIFLAGSYEQDQWNVFSIKANGTGLKQLTFKNTSMNHPIWSPDGNEIAVTIKENGFYQLYIMNPDGSGLTRISTNDKKNYNYPSWAPDSKKLVFSSEQDGGTEDIFTVNPDGSNEVQLTNNPANDNEPAWSPDGKKIVFVSNRNNFSEIYVMNSDGTNQTPLTSFKSAVLGPRWSPDGKYIVFASLKDQELWEIYIMKSDGKDVVRLTNNDTWDLRPKFSPDGKKIGWDSCCFNISVMNLDGSGVVKLYSEFEWDFDWKP